MEVRFQVPDWLVTVLVGLAYFIVLPLGFILITGRAVSLLALVPPLRGLWLQMVRWKGASEVLLLVIAIVTGVAAYRGFSRWDPSTPWIGMGAPGTRVPWGPRTRPKAWLSLAAFMVVALALIAMIGPTGPEECSDPSGVNC